MHLGPLTTSQQPGGHKADLYLGDLFRGKKHPAHKGIEVGILNTFVTALGDEVAKHCLRRTTAILSYCDVLGSES